MKERFRQMRTPIAMAAGSGMIGTAVAQLPPEVLVYRHSARAEQLHTGNDFGAAFAGMDLIIALQPRHDLGLPDGFDFKCAAGAFAAGQMGVSSIDWLWICPTSPHDERRDGTSRRGGCRSGNEKALGTCECSTGWSSFGLRHVARQPNRVGSTTCWGRRGNRLRTGTARVRNVGRWIYGHQGIGTHDERATRVPRLRSAMS